VALQAGTQSATKAARAPPASGPELEMPSTSPSNPDTPTADATGTPILNGRYVLQEMIGRGGMATVYRATDSVLDRPVAVKLLYPGISNEPQFVEQFLTMERHIARLFHPHLVTIFDAGKAEEGCFVVMEYVAGGSLRDLLAEGRALPVADVTRIVSQVADALQLLHCERIIHGDIKPDNILLDEDGNGKLVDFGIAHLATITGGLSAQSLSGSIPYLAPEQLQNGRADARSDVYALGLVTYELLAGRKAFDGENWVAVAAQRLARDPDPLRKVRAELPAEIEQIVMRALARDPVERFASSEEFRQALLQVQRSTRSVESAATARRHVVDRQTWELGTSAGLGPDTPAQATATLSKFDLPAQPAAVSDARPKNAVPEKGLGRSFFVRLLRGEHPLSLPVTTVVIALDLILLAIIFALLP
jgi:serine/threonine protein kinase